MSRSGFSLPISILIAATLLSLPSVPVRADENGLAKSISDLTKPAIVAAIVYNYAAGDKETAARSADAVLISHVGCELLKRATRERRPDGSDVSGFPSGHATGAFSLAAVLASKHKERAWVYYSLAAAVGWSRVELHKHRWSDVIGGALLGAKVGDWSVSSRDGLLIERVLKF